MAIYRVGLGLMLLYDLGRRSADLEAHYTNAGILTIAMTPEPSVGSTLGSLHLLLGSLGGQALLFGMAALLALGLILGWRTRLMSILSWWMLNSLHARNPLVNYGADSLLSVILLWSVFLPLGARFSLDARRAKPFASERAIASLGSLGYMMQVCFVYWFALLKRTGDTWWDGTAVYYTLSIDQYARPLGQALLEYPGLLSGLTWYTLLVEAAGPALLLIPIPSFRVIGVAVILSLQVGFLVCLDLGIFPLVSILALIPFLPGRLFERTRGAGEGAHEEEIGLEPVTLFQRCAGWLLVAVFSWNVAMLFRYPDELKAGLPTPVREFVKFFRVDQYWGMFSPNPMTFDGWYVISARLADGSEIDLLQRGQSLTWDKPANVARSFPNDRWKEYLMSLYDLGSPEALWQRYVDALVTAWNQSHPPKRMVDAVEVVYMMERTLPQGTADPEPEILWSAP